MFRTGHDISDIELLFEGEVEEEEEEGEAIEGEEVEFVPDSKVLPL